MATLDVSREELETIQAAIQDARRAAYDYARKTAKRNGPSAQIEYANARGDKLAALGVELNRRFFSR